MSEKQPISKEKLWKIFRQPEELLLKTTLKDEKKVKIELETQDICTVLYIEQLYIIQYCILSLPVIKS